MGPTDRRPGVHPGAPLAVSELPALFDRVHTALTARRATLDRLNVFPIPDGDTGTNMTLTVRSGLDALREHAGAAPRDVAHSVVRATIGGARGNSGVILSQVVRAVVEAVAGSRHVDAAKYASILERARHLAYEAVADPVEGTILTAMTVAAAEARAAADAGDDLVATSSRVCAATAAAVADTPRQLEVLRQAGVVDAGARGFEVVLAAVHGHLTGQEPDVHDDDDIPARTGAVRPTARAHATPFEVQYLLDAPDEAAAPLRRHLEQLGDSVVVAAADGLLNVHVHTADVGAAIESGLAAGRVSQIEVLHFADGHDSSPTHRLPVGVVAVLAGDTAQRFTRPGTVVVEGAGGSLPSVADLYGAIEVVGADHVVVLPGHRDAVATAVQAVELARAEGSCDAEVVTSATAPPAVLAALAVHDPAIAPERVGGLLDAAASAVRCGEVVDAVRDARTPAGRVRAGQPLAVLADGSVVAVAAHAVDAAEALCDALVGRDAELATLVTGIAGAEEIARVEQVLHAREVDVEIVELGHRPARFWIGVE